MILILTQCFPPRVGGIEQLMKGLADSLAFGGHEVIVYADGHASAGNTRSDAALHYSVVRFRGFKPLRRRAKARAVAGILARGGISGIFCDSWKSAELTARHAARHNVPVACLAHGNDVLAPQRAWRRRRMLSTLRAVRRVVANSRDTAARVESLGIDAEKISVVYPGVARPSGSGDFVGRAIPGGHPRLLTIGRIETRKGHAQVILSLPELIERHADLSYLIAGDGPGRSSLETLTSRLGLADRVHFLGVVAEEEKAAILAQTDLFVMPVRVPPGEQSVEGFGIVYVEAALFGIPSVAGRYGGAAEAVIHGETGIVCNGDRVEAVADAIHQLLDDEALRCRLGEAAKRRAESEFSWEQAVERYLACLA